MASLQNSEGIFHGRNVIRFCLPFDLNLERNLYPTKVMICIRGNVPGCLESNACSTCDSRLSVCVCV